MLTSRPPLSRLAAARLPAGVRVRGRTPKGLLVGLYGACDMVVVTSWTFHVQQHDGIIGAGHKPEELLRGYTLSIRRNGGAQLLSM